MASPLRLTVVVIAAVALGACHASTDPLDWHTVETLVAREFPHVPSLSPDELATRLGSASPPVVLIDAREADEFAVSHLPGAHHVASDIDAAARLVEASPEALVVAYCSVGYRSAALVSRLRERGYTNVVNLEGSIFRWVSDGRPVYRGDTEVGQVHPYNDRWGQLLPPALRSYRAGPPS